MKYKFETNQQAFAAHGITDQHIPERYRFRSLSLKRFQELGLPTVKSEDWRYAHISDEFLAQFSDKSSNIKSKPRNINSDTNYLNAISKLPFDLADKYVITFYNGLLATASKLPFTVNNLAKMWSQLPAALKPIYQADPTNTYKPFLALNHGLTTDGVYLEIPEHTQLDKPLVLLHINEANIEPQMVTVHNHIMIGAGAKVTLLEVYLSIANNNYFTNATTNIQLAERASLAHSIIQTAATDPTALVTQGEGYIKGAQLLDLTIEQQADSKLNLHALAGRGDLNRLELNVKLADNNANCTFAALECPRQTEVHDIQLNIDHLATHCVSNANIRGVVTDSARAAFTGRITVHQHATQAEADLQHKHLLLSPRAEADSRPQLEIYNDDVKCSHGSAIGQLDPQALFYMTTRGIPLVEAKQLLISGFIAEIIDTIPSAELRSWYIAQLDLAIV